MIPTSEAAMLNNQRMNLTTRSACTSHGAEFLRVVALSLTHQFRFAGPVEAEENLSGRTLTFVCSTLWPPPPPWRVERKRGPTFFSFNVIAFLMRTITFLSGTTFNMETSSHLLLCVLLQRAHYAYERPKLPVRGDATAFPMYVCCVSTCYV